jgi:hypothetical protein
MPQSEVLGQECGPRAKEGDEGPQKESNQAGHAARIRAENESEGTGPENAKPQSAEAPMRPFGSPMDFWRGTGPESPEVGSGLSGRGDRRFASILLRQQRPRVARRVVDDGSVGGKRPARGGRREDETGSRDAVGDAEGPDDPSHLGHA